MLSAQVLLEEMKTVQSSLLTFLEDDSNEEDSFQNLKSIFDRINIHSNIHKMKTFLRLLTKIATNHHRGPNFNMKVELILQIFLESIKQFPNLEKFEIFESSMLILLYLIEQKVMIVDDDIASKIYNYEKKNYAKYFSPEDFITYVTQKNCSPNSNIEPSIYETNPFLIEKEPSLIEYAAFYGSIQIFQYLKMNGADMTPFLWNYVIHSQNAELIHRLEEELINPKDANDCFNEALKCHHIDIANYIKDKLSKENENFTFIKSLKYFNFAFIQIQNINLSSFIDICRYGYSEFVKILLNYGDIDINHI